MATSVIKPLVMTPSPIAGESFRGYVLRLSEANGLRTPATMFGACGMHHLQIRLAEHPVEIVAALSARTPEDFRHLAYSMNDSSGQYILAGHPIKKQYLQIRSPRICPECIEEKGFIPARWDMFNSEVCHKHGRFLVDACPTCKKKLKWLRPGLLTCNCGADLSGLEGDRAPDALVDMAKVFSAVIERQTLSDSESITGMPFSNMTAMSLQTLAGIIHALGARSIRLAGKASFTKGGMDPVNEIREAAKILADWPKAFFDYLDRDAVSAPKDVTSFWKRHHATFAFIFKMDYDEKEVAFLKRAMLEYAHTRLTGVYVDYRLLHGVEDDFSNEFGGSMESLARKIGVRRITLKRRIARGTINVETICSGPKTSLALTTDIADGYLKNDRGEVNQRDLPKFVGLPVSTMKELRKIGVYHASHRTMFEKSWAVPDLEIFRDRILSKCIAPPEGSNGLVSIQNVMRKVFWSEIAKAEVIRAIDDGRLTAYGPATSILEIHVQHQDVIALTDECRHRETGLYQFNEVARILGCTVSSVVRMTDGGVLHSEIDKGGIRKLVKKQVDDFHSRFILLADACKEFRSSCHKARDVCLKAAIVIHENNAEAKSFPAYISRDDLGKYRKLMAR